MKSIIVAAFALLGSSPEDAPPMSKPTQLAVICFKTGERTSGMNRICYYDCMGSTAAITIGATELCPLSIDN